MPGDFSLNEKPNFKHMDTVESLVEKYGHKVKSGNIIGLGWENGWGKDTIDLHRELFELMDQKSYTRSGPAHNQQFEFTITEGETVYTVRWYLDSGD